MADDSVIRVLYGKNKKEVFEALDSWVAEIIQQDLEQAQKVEVWWQEFKILLSSAPKEELEMKARTIMARLVDIVQGSLLILDFQSDNNEVARLVMEDWFHQKHDNARLAAETTWKEQAKSDMKIVFGQVGPNSDRAKL